MNTAPSITSGTETIAITDHDGMCGVVRFAEAARELVSGPCSGQSFLRSHRISDG